MPQVSKGFIYKQKKSKSWYISFRIDGKPTRESARTEDRDAALAHLQKRIAEAKRGAFTSLGERITFEQMHQMLLLDYRFKRNRTNPSRHVMRLAESFAGMRGEDISEELIKKYCIKRRERDGMSAGTIRRELAVLHRMLKLAEHHLPRVPIIESPRGDNVRQGFFEEADLQAILPHLPHHARHLVEFLYLTGWRTSEAFRLQWRDVDWKQQMVLLRESKNREPRIFPFSHHTRLEQVLLAQRAEVTRWECENDQMCLSVFHWRGRPIQKLRRSWKRACRAAGLPDRLLHDFRRTAVRNLIRSGVPQSIAMKITGHKTGIGFRRYLIVDEEMLAQAVGKLAAYMESERFPAPPFGPERRGPSRPLPKK